MTKQIFTILSCLLCSLDAFAQMSIALSPTEVVLKGPPGSSVSQEFLVTNEGSTAYELGCLFEDLWFEKDKTVSSEMGSIKERQAAFMMQCTPNRILVPPKHVQKIKVVGAIPSGQEGETYTRFYAQMLPPGFGGATAMVGFSAKIGATISIAAEGTEKPSLDIAQTEVEVTQSFHRLHVDLFNTGNVHLLGEGALIVMDQAESIHDKVDFKVPFLFPSQTKKVSINLNEKLQKGTTYKAIFTLQSRQGPIVKDLTITY